MATCVLTEEAPQVAVLRRRIVLSVFMICLCIGIPIWNLTTRLYRAELPYDEIYALQSRALDEVHVRIPVAVDTSLSAETLLETQRLLDQHTSTLAIDWKVALAQSGDVGGYTLEIAEGETAHTSRDSKHMRLGSSDPGDLSRFLLDVFKAELESYAGNDDYIAIPFSAKYHISLSLLQGGGRPMSWDVERFTNDFKRYLAWLEPIANFTIDSQVEYYAMLSEDTVKNGWNETLQEFHLTERDMSTFIDHSEWGLEETTISENVINFVIYVPEKPIFIEGSRTNSFLVPQWGGLKILNTDSMDIDYDTLSPILEIFASHLLSLLGCPKTPSSLAIRIDSLTRMRTMRNIHRALNNLLSLAKLTKQLPTISIPDFTLHNVQSALTSIHSAIQSLNNGEFVLANRLSMEAVDQSDRAFFEKDMIQQMYFPDEHKMAVYVPLLGPFGVIISLGLLRILKEWRASPKSKTA